MSDQNNYKKDIQLDNENKMFVNDGNDDNSNQFENVIYED